ncbi:MAG TPA: TolC family protein, partial [Solimonas sp.]|nr:TolC family protein [Solimonas sp.]
FRLDWFARGDRADALGELAGIFVIDSRQKLLLRVADRYFGVLNAQDLVLQTTAEANAVRESLEDTRKRYEVELVPGTDLKEAQARDDLAQARLLSANRALENARDALDEVTGNGRVALPQIREDTAFPPLQPAQVDDWVKAAREHSPVIAQAKQKHVIAGADRRSRTSDAAPSLDLVASAGRSDDSDFIFGQRVDDSRVGLELTLPLYAGGGVSAARRQASAKERFAAAELKRITLETERQTRQLFNQVQTAYAETDAYKRALGSAQAAEKATRAGYEAGTRTITDVLDAQSRTVQARLNYDNTRYSLLLNLLQLKQTVGRLTEQDFAEIDKLLQPSQSIESKIAQ